MITVVGLGYGGEGGITLGALTKLKTAQKVYLRTGECAAAEFIAEMGIAFSTMDDLFEEADDFDKLNRAAACVELSCNIFKVHALAFGHGAVPRVFNRVGDVKVAYHIEVVLSRIHVSAVKCLPVAVCGCILIDGGVLV